MSAPFAPHWDHLTDDMTGKWIVTTAASTYILDMDDRRAIRIPGRLDDVKDGYVAADLRGDGQEWEIVTLIMCRTGVGMDVLGRGIAANDQIVTLRQTTPVLNIVKA